MFSKLNNINISYIEYMPKEQVDPGYSVYIISIGLYAMYFSLQTKKR